MVELHAIDKFSVISVFVKTNCAFLNCLYLVRIQNFVNLFISVYLPGSFREQSVFAYCVSILPSNIIHYINMFAYLFKYVVVSIIYIFVNIQLCKHKNTTCLLIL